MFESIGAPMGGGICGFGGGGAPNVFTMLNMFIAKNISR